MDSCINFVENIHKAATNKNIEQIYNCNLEFFNFLMSYEYNNKDNLFHINNVDVLYDQFRKHIFKCDKNSFVFAESIERTMKQYQVEIKLNKRNKLLWKLGAIKKSSSCPQLTKYNSCITCGCVNRCIFTSVQANVTQAFKNMDFDFDNKLTYIEFRCGLINILFGQNALKNGKILNDKQDKKDFVLDSINSTIRNEFLKCKFDTSLFYECPIDENVLFELFLRFDKNQDGVIDFGK